MQKKSKLMIYVQTDLAPDVMRWAIRLGKTVPGFCNACIADALLNMERGLQPGREHVPPHPWHLVNIWNLRQGKSFPTSLSAVTVQRAQARHQAEYRLAKEELSDFEKALAAKQVNTKILFQVNEGPDAGRQAERWPEKLRRFAHHFQIKPNELANQMIAAGMRALEEENALYEPDFMIEYRNNVVIPRIKDLQDERKLAKRFDPHSDVPEELKMDGWALAALRERSNIHNRELVDGFLQGKPPREALSSIVKDRTLSPAYLEKLKSIYSSPVYLDWTEPHPLREMRLKKEIIDACVEEWRRNNGSKSSERSVMEEIKLLLPHLTDTGLQAIQNEIAGILLYRGKGD